MLQGGNSPVKPSAGGHMWRSENEEKGRVKGDAEECLRGSRLSRLLVYEVVRLKNSCGASSPTVFVALYRRNIFETKHKKSSGL